MSAQTRQALMDQARQALAEGRQALTDIESRRAAGTLTTTYQTEMLDKHDRAAASARLFKRQADSLKSSDDLQVEFDALAGTVEQRAAIGTVLPADAHTLANLEARGADASGVDPRMLFAIRAAMGIPSRVSNYLDAPDPSVDHKARAAWPTEARAAYVKYLRGRRESSLSDVEMRALTPYADPDGGYVAIHELRNQVILQERNLVQIANYATIIETAAAAISFPTFKTKVQQQRVRVNKAIQTKDIRDVLGRTTFVPNEFGIIIKVPKQLVDDTSFPLINHLGREIALDAAETQEDQYLNGTGSNEPLGLLKAPIHTINSTAAGGAMTPEDVMGLPYELRAAFRRSAVWMFNRRGIQAVRRMRTTPTGVAGTGEFLWQIGLQAGEPDRLCGYPVLESEFFPDQFTTGATGGPLALFGDWSQYWIIRRLQLAVERLNELYAETSEVGFQYRMRYDAAPVRMEAFVKILRAS